MVQCWAGPCIPSSFPSPSGIAAWVLLLVRVPLELDEEVVELDDRQ